MTQPDPRPDTETVFGPATYTRGVDEMLRWWTPVMAFRRTATRDCVLGGQPIRAGDKVVVSFISANRDDAVFAEPGRFDIGRQPNPHLAFGHGPHFCLAPTWPAARCARCSARCWRAPHPSRTRASAATCAPTSSAA